MYWDPIGSNNNTIIIQYNTIIIQYNKNYLDCFSEPSLSNKDLTWAQLIVQGLTINDESWIEGSSRRLLWRRKDVWKLQHILLLFCGGVIYTKFLHKLYLWRVILCKGFAVKYYPT